LEGAKMVRDDEVSAGDAMKPPAITSRERVLTTPYFRLIGKRLEGQPAGEPYYSLDLLDYVTVVATTVDGSFVLVRQFRPAVETVTCELPAGHVELGQQPEDAARIELAEETGYAATDLRLVGCLKPDTGRLSNRMWVYFAGSARRTQPWVPEPGVDVVVASPGEMARWLNDGTFDHALHIAAIFLAVRAGCITL
jgi:8-oxo-dGTP pyrophosphatase MutT (NUDIX family)